MTVYGYGRVSTVDQELEIQLGQLRSAGCARIYCEKESGSKDARRQLLQLIAQLRPGDVVVVAALDRLTRGGPFKMLSILQQITNAGASYKSLAEPWADTTHELGEVLAALVGYIARKTREDLLRRTAAGRVRARERGVRFGRKPKLTDAERRAAIARRAAGESCKVIAAAFNVSAASISRLKAR